jgi:hypothetical protein
MAVKNLSLVTPAIVDVEALKAERDALNKKIREATRKTTAKPALTLEEVEQRQAERLNTYAHDIFAPLVNQRVRAGDTAEHAWRAISELYAPTLVAAVQVHEAAEGELSWDVAVTTALGRPRSRRQAKEQNGSAS